MTPICRLSVIYLATASVVLSGCEHRQGHKAPSTIAVTPRIDAMFEKTKVVCFGRFIVDVPDTAQLVWGHASINLGIYIYQNGAAEVGEMARVFKEELKNTEAINHNYESILLSEEKVSESRGRIIAGYESFDSLNGIRINGYFTSGVDGFVVSARPLKDEMAETVSEIKDIAQRLRPRAAGEVPIERGNCLENFFLKDGVDTDAEPPVEHVRIGFRLKEFPDTHLSIYTAPPNLSTDESDTLEWQLARIEARQKAEDPNHPLLQTKYFRRGARRIHEWINGWEAVSRSPDRPGRNGTHEFVMDFKGVPKDVYKPYADIQMQTGVEGNTAGAIKPTLTDKEAVAVWDRITNSIRVRPTSAAPTNANDKG